MTAGGQRIPNIGEQVVNFITNEGTKSSIKWQNADVTKPLLSVSHICDSGNEVTFSKEGGRITSLRTGRVIPFLRERGVYVPDMWVEAESSSDALDVNRDFPGQGG